MTALHDQSDGFFRRQIVLTTRDRPADRVDDPFLAEKLAAEREGIFLWCLEGLHRLIAQNYRFTISPKAQENVETVRRSSNNVVEFLQSEGTSAFVRTMRPVPSPSIRHIKSGARTMCASPVS